jgi:hypothetical protein
VGEAADLRVHNDEVMAISLFLAAALPYDYSAAAPAARQEVVRRVAEARGWPEPTAASFIDAFLHLLHTVKFE